MALSLVLKIKKCRQCKIDYTPTRFGQVVCSPACAIGYGKKQTSKQLNNVARLRRKETKEKLEKTKTLNDWLKEAQIVFNKYIRLRDAHLPCISCATTNPNIQYAAGHYRTVKAAPHLRFNEDNVNKQCNHYCNSQLSGNILEYRNGLIAKIGIERVEAIENNNAIRKYTIDEVKEMIVKFKLMCKEAI